MVTSVSKIELVTIISTFVKPDSGPTVKSQSRS